MKGYSFQGSWLLVCYLNSVDSHIDCGNLTCEFRAWDVCVRQPTEIVRLPFSNKLRRRESLLDKRQGVTLPVVMIAHAMGM